MHIKQKFCTTGLAMILTLMLFSTAFADMKDVLKRWPKTLQYRDQMGSELDVTVTYYSAEYIEALVKMEADKNLWTADEMENYKYELLQMLRLDEYIPIFVEFDNRGPAMHMAPFDRQIHLLLDGDKYSPVEYDKRFNFKLLGKRDGFVFFPRFDENTGESLLEGVKRAKVTISTSISSTAEGAAFMDFFWDIRDDDPASLYSGRAAAKLEIDRLIKRLEILSSKKDDLESQLAEVLAELDMVNQRIEELRKE